MKNPAVLKIYLIALAFAAWAEAAGQAAKGKVQGVVKTLDGQPAEFVTIAVKNTNYGSLTNEEGEFSLTLPAGDYTLVVSIIGFSSQEEHIVVPANKTIVIECILNETSHQLEEITVTGVQAVPGMSYGYLNDIHDNISYAGKKTEVLLVDTLDANTAQNNPRQVLGRIPGANYSETENNGFPSNGIGFRGLNPTQSIETNTRQNGYNIAADLYGYPESYYLPPLEAVERVEVTRSASSLQFGPQFGGVINYILKKGPANKPLQLATQQTVGSFGFYSSFLSAGGQIKKINYYAYTQYQTIQGWRPNSETKKLTGYARIEYQANQKIKIGLEYSVLQNKIKMPGGLSDSLFYRDSRRSYRTRNWLRSPWQVITGTFEWKLSSATTLTLVSVTNNSARDLVWRNENGGPDAADAIDPLTNEYVNRERQHEGFTSNTTELRLLTRYNTRQVKNMLAYGVRFFHGRMKRQGGGLGTTGSDFDFTLLAPKYEYDLNFTTTNVAIFAENSFTFNRLSITPGFRYEYLNSTANGYALSEDEITDIQTDLARRRYLFMAGIGFQFKTSATSTMYANWSQTYRPINYSDLTSYGNIGTTAGSLKDATGYTSDIGFRGFVKDYLNFDVGLFYIQYNNRIGLVNGADSENHSVPYAKNLDNSAHKGLELYLEFNPLKALTGISRWSFSFFNSFAVIDARYVTGPNSGNHVEYAPPVIDRLGATLTIQKLSTTFLVSYTDKSYGDAENTTAGSNAVPGAGVIPSYTIMDWSSTFRLKKLTVKAGVNNLTDAHYFTKRTDEYPGPGIIPAVGRSFYLGAGVAF